MHHYMHQALVFVSSIGIRECLLETLSKSTGVEPQRAEMEVRRRKQLAGDAKQDLEAQPGPASQLKREEYEYVLPK